MPCSQRALSSFFFILDNTAKIPENAKKPYKVLGTRLDPCKLRYEREEENKCEMTSMIFFPYPEINFASRN